MFWAVARHLPGIYPRFAYLSAPLISGSERNDRETANDTERNAEIVKCIRKLLLLRQTTFCDPLHRVAAPSIKRIKTEIESSQVLSITGYKSIKGTQQ